MFANQSIENLDDANWQYPGERGFLVADVDFGEPSIRSCEDDVLCHIYIDEMTGNRVRAPNVIATR